MDYRQRSKSGRRLGKNLAASEAALQRHRETLAARQEALRQLEEDLRQKQEALRTAQSEAFAAAQDLTQIRNEITALDLQKQGNVVRLEKLSAEKIQLEEERSRLEARLRDFAANVEAQKLSAQTHRGTVEQRQQRLHEIQHEITAVGQKLDSLLHQQSENRSRLNVLDQLQAEHEGFSAGTLAALKQTEAVLGSLADKIRVPDQYVAAVEAALGHHLQLVLTEQPDAAQQILANLSAHKKGRASIASLALNREDQLAGSGQQISNGSEMPAPGLESVLLDLPSESTPASPIEQNGFSHLRATAIVEAEDSVKPLVQRLLGMTRIVTDLAPATEAWRD